MYYELLFLSCTKHLAFSATHGPATADIPTLRRRTRVRRAEVIYLAWGEMKEKGGGGGELTMPSRTDVVNVGGGIFAGVWGWVRSCTAGNIRTGGAVWKGHGQWLLASSLKKNSRQALKYADYTGSKYFVQPAEASWNSPTVGSCLQAKQTWQQYSRCYEVPPLQNYCYEYH